MNMSKRMDYILKWWVQPKKTGFKQQTADLYVWILVDLTSQTMYVTPTKIDFRNEHGMLCQKLRIASNRWQF